MSNASDITRGCLITIIALVAVVCIIALCVKFAGFLLAQIIAAKVWHIVLAIVMSIILIRILVK